MRMRFSTRNTNGSTTAGLARKELRRMTGVEVLREDWNLEQVPEHLKVTFRAVDHRNRKLKEK